MSSRMTTASSRMTTAAPARPTSAPSLWHSAGLGLVGLRADVPHPQLHGLH